MNDRVDRESDHVDHACILDKLVHDIQFGLMEAASNW